MNINYLPGKRVRCIHMYDIFDSTGEEDKSATALQGVCGTVDHVDGMGQIHVNWDNGSTLALNSLKDKFEILD